MMRLEHRRKYRILANALVEREIFLRFVALCIAGTLESVV
jgi:hypothetical protein